MKKEKSIVVFLYHNENRGAIIHKVEWEADEKYTNETFLPTLSRFLRESNATSDQSNKYALHLCIVSYGIDVDKLFGVDRVDNCNN